MKRRQFLSTLATTGAGTMFLPHVTLFGANAPSNKLNIALIGTWGRGEAHFGAISTENVVALCDVDEEHLAFRRQAIPGGQDRTWTGGNASSKRTSTRWSAAPPTTRTPLWPTGP